MAKRFTDSNKWEDDWFASLPPKYKLFWFYICDRCDHAGVWKISAHVASALIGETVDLAEAQKLFDGRIELHEGFWWIKKFCNFQYGNLNPDNKTHKSVLKILETQGLSLDSLGISENLEESSSSRKGAMDKDKVKAKDNSNNERWEKFWNVCTNKQGKIPAKGAWDKLTPEEQETAIRMWGPYAANCAKRQISLKHPQGWLNDKRFNDQFESGPRKDLKTIRSMDDL